METRQSLKDYATEYTIGEYKIAWRGKGWGVYQGMGTFECYDKILKEFILEPRPSSRDDKFFKACRFGLVEAVDIVATIKKQR